MIAQEGNSFFTVVFYFCPDIKELQDCQNLLPTRQAGCEPALSFYQIYSQFAIPSLHWGRSSWFWEKPVSPIVTERLEVLLPDKLDTSRNGTFPGDLSPTPSRHSPAWFCIKAYWEPSY